MYSQMLNFVFSNFLNKDTQKDAHFGFKPLKNQNRANIAKGQGNERAKKAKRCCKCQDLRILAPKGPRSAALKQRCLRYPRSRQLGRGVQLTNHPKFAKFSPLPPHYQLVVPSFLVVWVTEGWLVVRYGVWLVCFPTSAWAGAWTALNWRKYRNLRVRNAGRGEGRKRFWTATANGHTGIYGCGRLACPSIPSFYVNGGSPGSRQLRFRPFAPFCSKVSRERRQAVTQQVAREEQQKRSTGLAQRSPGPGNDRVGECDWEKFDLARTLEVDSVEDKIPHQMHIPVWRAPLSSELSQAGIRAVALF